MALSQEELEDLYKSMRDQVKKEFGVSSHIPLDTEFSIIVDQDWANKDEHRVSIAWKSKLYWEYTIRAAHFMSPWGGPVSYGWKIISTRTKPSMENIRLAVNNAMAVPVKAEPAPVIEKKEVKSGWDLYQEKMVGLYSKLPCYFCTKDTTMGLPSLVPCCAACVLRHVKPFFVAE